MALLQLFIAGLLLGFIFVKTKSVYTTTAFHFAWNFFEGIIFGLPVSGHRYNGVFQIELQNSILTGGAYGPEGGIIGVAVTLFLFVVLLVVYCHNKMKECMEED